MKMLIIAALATGLIATAATASPKSDAIAVATGFFTNPDFAAAVKTCSPEAVVIDDFAPHVWQGKDACAAWLAAFAADNKKNGITPGTVTVGKVQKAIVTGADAYVVMPGVYNYTQNGKAIVNKATVTVALHKGKAGWMITGWSWGQTS